MGQKSSISRLPKKAQSQLHALYDDGLTLDEIVDEIETYLSTLDGNWKPPSRSAIGRHRKNHELVAERMREAREMAEAIATEIGEIPDDKMNSMLVDLLRTLVFKVLQRSAESEDEFDPKELHFLARGLKDIASASAISTKQAQAIKDMAREEAANDVKKAGEEAGLTEDTLQRFYKAAKGT